MKPGMTTLDLNVSSTVNGILPSAIFTSSSEPTATMRLPDTATAVADGWLRSMVTTLVAV
jgi:hypothetical protein